MTRILRLLAPLLLVLAMAPACSSSDGSLDPSGDKNDDLGEPSCATAALDEHGICRNGNGTFAANSCCEAEFAVMCANTNPDTTGEHCRNEITGQFAPAVCCEVLCQGAALDQHGICRNTDGTFADHGCCADECFVAQETGLDADDFENAGSCEGACGAESDVGGCFCDDDCAEFGDCCADKVDECGGEGSTASCAGICGDAAPAGCFCDELCATLGDCCGDKVDECGGAGNALPDCNAPCANAVLEQGTGICRDSENGQFVNAECCAIQFEELCENSSPDQDGEHCRNDDSGQFVPAICCAALCEGAALDRHGFCRNTDDGTFAHDGCCADECVSAQGNLGRNVDCGAIE